MRSMHAERRGTPVEYDPTLVEAAVEDALRAPGRAHGMRRGLGIRLMHRRALDRLYGQPPGADREMAFRAHYLERFRELGLERRLRRCLDRFPTLGAIAGGILVEAAAAEPGEGAELYEDHERRGTGSPGYLVVRVLPHRLCDQEELDRTLLFRLQMVADVLDPEFGFDASATRPRGPYGSRTRYLTQRLWELSARRRVASVTERQDASIAGDLAALLPGEAGSSRRRVDELVHEIGEPGCCTFAKLAERARLLADTHRGGIGGERAGLSCPLCSFPTHAWAAPETIARVEGAVGRDFPAWCSSQGCCETCADRYLFSAEVMSGRR